MSHQPERREATTPDFVDAYESGFQRGMADIRGELERDMANGSSIEATFAERWHSLSTLEAPGLDRHVRSGEADAWLERRYRALGIVRRDLSAANALLFLSNWEAFTGKTASRAQSDGALRQIEHFLAKRPPQESSSELEDRRRVYELMAATVARESQRVRDSGDAAKVEAMTQTLRTDFKRQSNNDLAEFTLTDEGFEER